MGEWRGNVENKVDIVPRDQSHDNARCYNVPWNPNSNHHNIYSSGPFNLNLPLGSKRAMVDLRSSGLNILRQEMTNTLNRLHSINRDALCVQKVAETGTLPVIRMFTFQRLIETRTKLIML